MWQTRTGNNNNGEPLLARRCFGAVLLPLRKQQLLRTHYAEPERPKFQAFDRSNTLIIVRKPSSYVLVSYSPTVHGNTAVPRLSLKSEVAVRFNFFCVVLIRRYLNWRIEATI
jgi:hypothetical protein